MTENKEENKEENEEETEVEVTEILLNEGDINDLIGKLEELKESKKEITYELDDENELLIKYYSDVEENEDEEEEEE